MGYRKSRMSAERLALLEESFTQPARGIKLKRWGSIVWVALDVLDP